MLTIDRKFIQVQEVGSRWQAVCIFNHKNVDDHYCKIGLETHRRAKQVGWNAYGSTPQQAISHLRKAVPPLCVDSFQELP